MLNYWILFGLFGNLMCIDRKWWKTTEMYEVYIMSFKDSDGDGIGDLNGIKSKLDHFLNLQIGSIWISPFYESPLDDMGYDISNYTNINPLFGTMEDFEELTKEAAKRGIKIIIDFVINHSSDEHVWFKKSVDKIKPYDEYYIWQDPKGHDSDGKPIPPNNWLSLFEESAWIWNDKRKQFYYHAFGKKQPEFNLRNEAVKREIKNIIEFWYAKGVSGLRMDAVENYIEDSLFRDEPLLNPNIKKDKYSWHDYDHKYTWNLWETYQLIHELRVFQDGINEKKGGTERIMVAEAFGKLTDVMKYYGSEKYPIAHFPFNFIFAVNKNYFTSGELHEKITHWMKHMPGHGGANWVAESHDVYRIGGRFVREYVHIINFLIMMLPGVACVYYGQEIGMVNGPVRSDQVQDLHITASTLKSRDYERTPMQWDDSMNAGFTTKRKSWLPVNPNYWSENVETQKKSKNSFYTIFKELSRLRKTKTCKFGAFNSYVLSKWIYAFTRVLNGSETYVVVMNLGTELEIVNLSGEIPNLANFLKVLVASDNAGYKKGDKVKSRSAFSHIFVMRPLSVIVLACKTAHKFEILAKSDKVDQE